MAAVTSNELLSFNQFKNQLTPIIEDKKFQDLVGYSSGFTKKINRISTLEQSIENIDPQKNPVLIRKTQTEIAPLTRELKNEREKKIQDCFKIYTNAYAPKKGELFLLGGENLRKPSAKHELINFGILSSGKTQCPANAKSHVENQKTGMILCDGSWFILKNDSAMLGIIHSLREVHIFGKASEEDLWDKEKNRPRVLGREIAMLHAAGYRQVVQPEDSKKYGMVLTHTDKNQAHQTELPELINAVDKLQSLQEINEMLEPISPTELQFRSA